MLVDAKKTIEEAIKYVMPEEAVKKALKDIDFTGGRLILVAAGKAAWEMAKAADEELGEKVSKGVVITKYDHSKGPIGSYGIYEAGHPIPDANSFAATEKAIEAVKDLTYKDKVLFLLSGGGSALFEKPLVSPEELADVTKQLLSCGADIKEINTIRKRLSSVKGGRFAMLCKPAKVYTIVLSDIIGDPLDMIASGPAYADSSTFEEALNIVNKYNLKMSPEAKVLLVQETPKELTNVSTYVTGSVKQLCISAEKTLTELGYKVVFLTASLDCEASSAGQFLGCIARDNQKTKESIAFIAGGETVVHLKGSGKGGRNQELALAAAPYLSGCENTAVFSFGSDGTDGPTDAAGGYADQDTEARLKEKGISISDVLMRNDAYNALKKVDGLIMTGPTGTNVNDLAVLLIRR